MVLRELSDAPGTAPRQAPAADDVRHKMRELTLRVAFENEWSEDTAQEIADMFSAMAGEWTASHDHPGRIDLLNDALDRGEVAGGRVVELGSGTGLGTRELAKRYDNVFALDRSDGMLDEAPSEYGPRVLADAAALPFESGSIDTLVLINMILFPAEADRVLAAGGAMVWVNTFGEQTPIHLSAEEVHQALPGEWHVTHARAGTGTWSVARR